MKIVMPNPFSVKARKKIPIGGLFEAPKIYPHLQQEFKVQISFRRIQFYASSRLDPNHFKQILQASACPNISWLDSTVNRFVKNSSKITT